MQPTDKKLSAHVIDIVAIYQGHIKIMPNILEAYALSECDTVFSNFGIGKKTAINVLNKDNINCYQQIKVETLHDAWKKM